MSTPYSPQHRWMEWLVDVQVASRGCGSPVCLHTSRLGTADDIFTAKVTAYSYSFDSTKSTIFCGYQKGDGFRLPNDFDL